MNGLELNLEKERVIAEDNVQDENILPQPYNNPGTEPAEDILNDIALSLDAESTPPPKRTRLPPTQLMYATSGQPANYHINYIQQIPRYVEPFNRTVGLQMIPFMPGYVPSYHQLFMTPRVVFRHPEQ